MSDRTRYLITAEVKRTFREPDGNWFAHFAGSWESLCMGAEEPDFRAGDHVRISIERVGE